MHGTAFQVLLEQTPLALVVLNTFAVVTLAFAYLRLAKEVRVADKKQFETDLVQQQFSQRVHAQEGLYRSLDGKLDALHRRFDEFGRELVRLEVKLESREERK